MATEDHHLKEKGAVWSASSQCHCKVSKYRKLEGIVLSLQKILPVNL